MNLQELSQYDVKNVDMSHIQQQIMRRKDILVIVAVIGVAIFFAIKLLGHEKQEIQRISLEKKSIEEKADLLTIFEEKKTELDSIKDNLPQGFKNLNTLSNKLNKMSLNHDVQIISFKPNGTVSTDYAKMMSVRIEVMAKSYKKLGLFLYSIESSDKNLRIENWTLGGAPTSYRGRRGWQQNPLEEVDEENISSTIEIVSTFYKK